MRVAVIGTNFVTDMFMDGAVLVPECEVTAVCGTSVEKARRFADKYNIPYAFGDYTELPTSGVCDAVYLGVPNGKHHDMAIYFLEHHMPVLCEKPFASNAREVSEMIASAKKNNTYLQDAIVPLYAENFENLKNALPKVGKVRQVIVHFGKYSSRYDAYLRGENPTTFRRELSNGAIMDLGIYALSDIVGLFGKPERVVANGVLLDTKVDASGCAILGYGDFEAIAIYSKVSDSKIVSEIQGEEGTIYIADPSRLSQVWFESRLTKEREDISTPSVNGFKYEIEEWCQCVAEGKIESDKVPFTMSQDIHDVVTECRRQMGVIFPADEVQG